MKMLASGENLKSQVALAERAQISWVKGQGPGQFWLLSTVQVQTANKVSTLSLSSIKTDLQTDCMSLLFWVFGGRCSLPTLYISYRGIISHRYSIPQFLGCINGFMDFSVHPPTPTCWSPNHLKPLYLNIALQKVIKLRKCHHHCNHNPIILVS